VGVAVALTASSNGASQAVIGGLSGVGSALSGYIAATFLQARRESLSQLNHYFRQPLATSYLLTAERLADKVSASDAAQGDVWKELVGQIAGHAFDSIPDPAIT
jgi:hypothetical protein